MVQSIHAKHTPVLATGATPENGNPTGGRGFLGKEAFGPGQMRHSLTTTTVYADVCDDEIQGAMDALT